MSISKQKSILPIGDIFDWLPLQPGGGGLGLIGIPGIEPVAGLSADDIVYLLRVGFNTADAAPLTNPYAGEVGSLIPTEVDGTLAAASSLLANTVQASHIEGDLGFCGIVKYDRVAGRSIYIKITPTTLGTYPIVFWGLNLNPNATNADAALRVEATLVVNDLLAGGLSLGRTLSTSTAYQFWLILLATGAYLIGKGGVLTVPRLVWTFITGATAQLSAAVGYWSTGIANIDDFNVVDLPTSLLSAIAVVNKTTFEQSLGSELFLNNDFATWSGDNPSNWTVFNEIGATREVTERDPTQLHVDVKTTGGAANVFDSTTTLLGIYQNVAVTGKIYQMEVDVTAWASSASGVYFGGGDGQAYSMSGTGLRRIVARSMTGGSVWPIFSASCDFTVNTTSFKEVLLNTAQVMPADAELDYVFTVPGSPVAGQEIHVCYRIAAAGEEFYNCWDAYLRRSDDNTTWAFRLDSIVNGTRTNRINAASAGTVVRMRARCVGNDHDCWTLTATAWTKRGGTINNSTHATATGLNTIASSGFTETALIARQANLAAYESSLYT